MFILILYGQIYNIQSNCTYTSSTETRDSSGHFFAGNNKMVSNDYLTVL